MNTSNRAARLAASILTLGALVGSAAWTTASETPTVSAAASLNLNEVGGTPLTYSLGGYDLDFATNSVFSSPAVADVTGDGQPDIVIGGLNSKVHVYDIARGQTIVLDPGGADLATGHGATQASPVIADLNADGVDDVVIANTGGRLAAYSVRNGSPVQLFNRYVPPEFEGAIVGLFGTPAIGYVDLDTTPDIVTSSWGQTVDVFSGRDGGRLDHMHQWLRDTIWSSPVIGDITGDGTKSIVVGADCDGSGSPQPCYGTGKGGYVWAFRMDGTERWRYFVRDAVVWSTPALVDLNGDGALDVVVGTGLYFLGPAANQVMALDGKTGQLLWSAPTEGPVMGSPAVADVNGQPRIWIVAGGGQVLSFDKSGRRVWQQCITDGQCAPDAGTYGGVAVADIDNDGRLEAVVQGEQQLRVFDAESGAPRAAVRSGYGKTLFASMATPTIASVGGKTWIVQLNVGDANGNFQTDGGDELVVTVWTTGTSLGDAPWPTFKGNMARTGGPLPDPPRAIPPGGTTCFGVAGSPGDAAIVNLTPVKAEGSGYGLLTSSDITTTPNASNVNYAIGTTDPNVAIATIGADGRVCFHNAERHWVHLVADHLGTIDVDAYTPATNNGGPLRTIDTRIGQGGGTVQPSGRVCFGVAGSPGDAAVVNLTPVRAQSFGHGLLTSSDIVTTPNASNVNYTIGTTDPNVAIATIGSNGQICYHNADLAIVDIIADHLGTIDADAYTPATSDGAPLRKVDTRSGQGGTTVPPAGRVCFGVAGSPGDAAIVNLTPVRAQARGHGLLISSDIASPPNASNVNYAFGTTDPNVAIATIGSNGQVCYHNADLTAVDIIADHLGTIDAAAYTPATPSGAPLRKIDTRVG